MTFILHTSYKKNRIVFLLFCDWFVSLGIMSSSSSMLLNVRLSFHFMAEWYSYIYMYNFSANRYLGCFHIFWLLKTMLLNTGVLYERFFEVVYIFSYLLAHFTHILPQQTLFKCLCRLTLIMLSRKSAITQLYKRQ